MAGKRSLYNVSSGEVRIIHRDMKNVFHLMSTRSSPITNNTTLNTNSQFTIFLRFSYLLVWHKLELRSYQSIFSAKLLPYPFLKLLRNSFLCFAAWFKHKPIPGALERFLSLSHLHLWHKLDQYKSAPGLLILTFWIPPHTNSVSISRYLKPPTISISDDAFCSLFAYLSALGVLTKATPQPLHLHLLALHYIDTYRSAQGVFTYTEKMTMSFSGSAGDGCIVIIRALAKPILDPICASWTKFAKNRRSQADDAVPEGCILVTREFVITESKNMDVAEESTQGWETQDITTVNTVTGPPRRPFWHWRTWKD